MTTFLGKIQDQYICDCCNLKTNNKKDFEKHKLTAKHLKAINGKNLCVLNGDKFKNIPLACQCGKMYKHHSSLWKHKKLCINKNTQSELDMVQNMSDKELIMYLLKENKEFKELILEQSNKMFEQSNKMLELAAKPTNIINNTNSNNNNKQFNLQVFLNEKCKNAMNMSEFLDTIQIEDDDFENIGKLGYIQGISNIFIKGLKDLDETLRPLHCNDIKRETLYIKDNDVWEKDDNKHKIRNVIAIIAHKNFKYIPVWQEANPSSFDVTNKKNDLYMKIANQVTTAITPDDESGINKIIRNVANKVLIDKEGALSTSA
jgi:hypothetical protein|uniref:C2H2-type domain-containing protein n=1 Tax=viral metagenome TaxID=1070528 RepID=A0A6C0HDR2_9ZZZZ